MHGRSFAIVQPASARAARGIARRYPRLRLSIAFVWCTFFAYSLYFSSEEPLGAVVAALVIATLALLPGYLWADGRVPGLPVLPLHTLMLLWTFALPLIAGHPEIANYDSEDIQFATLCIAVYAASATAIWLFVATRPIGKRAYHYVLPENRGFTFLVAAIYAGGLFIGAAVSHAFDVSPGVFGLLRSSILAFASIALFILSARMGRGDLNWMQRSMFILGMAFYVTIQLTTVFLVGAVVSVASALIGYTIGRGRVPWFTVLAALLLFAFLHNGKGEMRERYWAGGSHTVKIHELPEFFVDWFVAGASQLRRPDPGTARVPFYERLSLMHILLFVQRNAPDNVPFLEGATYTIVPRLLVPRILDPGKPSSHQGTTMLNVHFGIQSVEDTERTTVGWGLLNEGYANFGLAGVAGVGAFLGLLFGLVGRLTAGAPVMSLEGMIGITFCAIAIQAEFTMAVFATVLFQSLIALVLVLPLLERRRADQVS